MLPLASPEESRPLESNTDFECYTIVQVVDSSVNGNLLLARHTSLTFERPISILERTRTELK